MSSDYFDLLVFHETEVEASFCKCPFCPCCFFTREDLERHMAAFGSNREEHSEDYRRTHGRVEYGSASGPE